MGERKGQNLYYPPDYDPKVGGLNKFMGTHALRERARKLHMGILIIRFEMPYNIWCDGCGNHIGMGVRYNAEKTKVGMYYTTPVYQFRMKCHLCDNHFEIKTDPANLDYVIVSGARRQENRWDPTENGQVVPETKETQKKLFDDAMFRLEHKTGDEDTAKEAKPRLGRLVGRNEAVWKDDYEANCSLRRNFRKRRKELEESSVNDSLLLAKSSLNIRLLPESEEDRNMAMLLSLKPAHSIEEKHQHTRTRILESPALPGSGSKLGVSLHKEDVLGKNASLTRHALGITLKKSKNSIQSNDCEDCSPASSVSQKDEACDVDKGRGGEDCGPASSVPQKDEVCDVNKGRGGEDCGPASSMSQKDEACDVDKGRGGEDCSPASSVSQKDEACDVDKGRGGEDCGPASSVPQKDEVCDVNKGRGGEDCGPASSMSQKDEACYVDKGRGGEDCGPASSVSQKDEACYVDKGRGVFSLVGDYSSSDDSTH